MRRADEGSDLEDDGQAACPYCGREIYEDSERCPYCENYLSREDAPSRHPVWILITVLICLALVGLWILGRN
jgi:hypothetical protein